MLFSTSLPSRNQFCFHSRSFFTDGIVNGIRSSGPLLVILLSILVLVVTSSERRNLVTAAKTNSNKRHSYAFMLSNTIVRQRLGSSSSTAFGGASRLSLLGSFRRTTSKVARDYERYANSCRSLSTNNNLNMENKSVSAAGFSLQELEDDSFESLQERMQRYVEEMNRHHRSSLVVKMSGGGGHFLSTLSSTPGASSILLEGSNLYHRESYSQYVKLRSRRQQHQSDNPKNQKDTSTEEQFKYCSDVATSYLADSALHRSMELNAIAFASKINEHKSLLQRSESSRVSDYSTISTNTNSSNYVGGCNQPSLLSPCGVASTSALYTTTRKDGSISPPRLDRVSRANIAIHTASGIQMNMNIRLASATAKQQRSRFDEDVFVSHCILSCLEYATNSNSPCNSLNSIVDVTSNDDARDNNHLISKYNTSRGDEISIEMIDGVRQASIESMDINDYNDKPLYVAAHRILSGGHSTAMLVPSLSNDGSDAWTYQLLTHTVLPPGSLLVPGSFNPPHHGHVELAKRAAEISGCTTVWFELSMTNADKPPLEAKDVVGRLKQFLEMQKRCMGDDETSNDDCVSMPNHWGVLLTDAPLFTQKVDALSPLLVHSDDEDPDSIASPLHFCIGTDTLVRLVDTKYYSNSEEKMLDVLINQMPCHFVVGGRLEQINKNISSSKTTTVEPKFVTGEELLANLPEALRSKFTILPNFRIDTSSTELRRTMAGAEEKNKTT